MSGLLGGWSASTSTIITEADAEALAGWYRRRAEQHYQVLIELGLHQRVYFPNMLIRYMGSYVSVPDAARAFGLPPADRADGARLLL